MLDMSKQKSCKSLSIRYLCVVKKSKFFIFHSFFSGLCDVIRYITKVQFFANFPYTTILYMVYIPFLLYYIWWYSNIIANICHFWHILISAPLYPASTLSFPAVLFSYRHARNIHLFVPISTSQNALFVPILVYHKSPIFCKFSIYGI